jgi:hypothetical protein
MKIILACWGLLTLATLLAIAAPPTALGLVA